MIELRSLAWIALIGLCLSVPSHGDHGPQTWQRTHASVVAILPTWPGYDRPGFGAPRGTAPEGSGFFWTARNGSQSTPFIVTAAHVVSEATRIEARDASGNRFDLELIAIDAASDLALLRAPTEAPGLETISTMPPPGTHVCALGNPFGVGISMSCGVVSAPLRDELGMQSIESFVQTDTAINPGSSGGPLVDASGVVVGVMTVMFSRGADIDAGVNFAVSGDVLVDRLAPQAH